MMHYGSIVFGPAKRLSFFAGPTGEIVESADGKSDTVLVAKFDLNSIKVKRHSWGVFRDRRPELYKVLLTLDGHVKPAAWVGWVCFQLWGALSTDQALTLTSWDFRELLEDDYMWQTFWQSGQRFIMSLEIGEAGAWIRIMKRLSKLTKKLLSLLVCSN